MLSCSYAQPPPQKPEVPRFPEQKRKQIDILSWAPEILLQQEKICDAFSAATHRIPFPKLSECSISPMHPKQQNSFLSIKWERIQDKNHYRPNYGLGLVFSCRINQCLSSVPWTEEQLIPAHCSHLADAKGLGLSHTPFQATLDTMGKVLATPARSRPGR